jgi:hypothetical protein
MFSSEKMLEKKGQAVPLRRSENKKLRASLLAAFPKLDEAQLAAVWPASAQIVVQVQGGNPHTLSHTITHYHTTLSTHSFNHVRLVSLTATQGPRVDVSYGRCAYILC